MEAETGVISHELATSPLEIIANTEGEVCAHAEQEGGSGVGERD